MECCKIMNDFRSNMVFSRRHWGKTFSFALFLLAATLLLSGAGCTEYERNGINARPFNEPRSWEINPYGQEAFRN